MPVRAVDDKPSDTLVVVSGEGFWTGSSTLPHLHHRHSALERPDRPDSRGDPVEQAQGGQRGLARRLEQESRPDGAWRGCLLEDRDIGAVARKGDSGGPTSDPESDDRAPHTGHR